MLPHFVAQDFDDVLDDLQRAGWPLQPEWFAPHLEFRFPPYGAITRRGVHVELRQALEPWHVIGEEQAAGGTARYVDSSVERLQVKVTGMTGSRHVIVVQRPAGAAASDGTTGRVRGRRPISGVAAAELPASDDPRACAAWFSTSWIPGIERSLGGCVYHVAHPGGRSFETFPVNSYEAESRRLARFFGIGHTPGALHVPTEDRNPDFPLTLDLRRPLSHTVAADAVPRMV